MITDFGISARHLDRLLGGLVLATAPRVDWAKLPQRTFALDVLRCAHSGGCLHLLAAITDRAMVRGLLEHLDASAELVTARPGAREPAELRAEAPPWRRRGGLLRSTMLFATYGPRPLLRLTLVAPRERPLSHDNARGSAISTNLRAYTAETYGGPS